MMIWHSWIESDSALCAELPARGCAIGRRSVAWPTSNIPAP